MHRCERKQSMYLCTGGIKFSHLYFTPIKNPICSFSAWSMLRTHRAKTHTHKDILRALMFIKQPAEMKPIRLCSPEKHSQRGDRPIHAESRINIKAARQALFPVSSFLPGQNKLQRRRMIWDVLHTVLILTFLQGKIGFSKSFKATERDHYSFSASRQDIGGQNR